MLSLLLPLFMAHANPPPAEQVKYLEARDAYIKQIAANPKKSAELDARDREKLEAHLRQIIGPARVSGFTELGKLNLETLVKDDPGFGQVDGLLFVNGAERLFITTPYLLDRYSKGLSSNPRDASELFKSNEFYSRVFSWDVAFTIMADVPYGKSDIYDLAGGFIALAAQDTGAFPPKDLLVVAIREDRIYVVNVEVPEMQIAKCAALHRKVSGKSPTPEQSEKAYAAYQTCWKENAKSQPFFPALQNRVDEIVGRLR